METSPIVRHFGTPALKSGDELPPCLHRLLSSERIGTRDSPSCAEIEVNLALLARWFSYNDSLPSQGERDGESSENVTT